MPSPQNPLKRSLLDRLIDEAPTADRDPPKTERKMISELRQHVQRDLKALLNYRATRNLEGFPCLQSSVFNYGVTDFSRFEPDDLDALRDSIEWAIQTFEPRLKNVRVERVGPTETEPTVRFRILADHEVESWDPFTAVLDLRSKTFDMTGDS